MFQNENNLFVSNRYVPIKKIGEGGMGSVFKCTDITVNRPVAIKILKENIESSFIQRFHTEAKATAKLDHPNIVKVLDFGQLEDGKLFLAMEYIEGVGLDSIIEKRGFLPLEEAIPILEQIISGLKHSHSHNILHRDIKPSNIIVSNDRKNHSVVKILDFGIAKFENDSEQELTKTGAALGSAAYMSPEAASSQPQTKASDIYSFGCLMFELLTGEKPFIGNSYMETLVMQKEELPRPLNDCRKEDFPEAIENIVRKCLKKKPQQRYESADELLVDLNNYENTLSIGSLSELVEEYEASSAGDNKRMTYLVIGLALFFIIGVSVLLSAEKLISIFVAKDTNEKKEEPLQSFIFNQMAEIKPKLVKHSKSNSYDVVGNVQGNKEQLKFLKGRDDIVGLNFTADDIKGNTLEYLSVKSLVHFNSRGCELDDQTFAYLSKAKKLSTVNLVAAHGLTKEAMVILTDLPELSRLSLAKTPITDEQFAPICSSPRLKSLDISQSPLLTVKSFRNIARIQKLDTLVLKYSDLSEDKLEALSQSKSITDLELTALPPGYLKYLKKMRLKILAIHKNEEISDKAALALAALPKLKSIEFINCPKLTESLKLKLKAAFPNLKVKKEVRESHKRFPLLELKPEDKFSH